MRGKKPALIATQELERLGSEVYTTAINFYELLLGARRLRKIAETEAPLADLAVLASTKKAVNEELRYALMPGVALAHGIKSVVSNDEDLKRVREIQVRTY
ncbi:hypothetical protein KEJ51_08445 [Candidatus Bathyarchaeota archaeon]|nr:hypothetical protein [Candidatus Bathyarchaeota archaeon]